MKCLLVCFLLAPSLVHGANIEANLLQSIKDMKVTLDMSNCRLTDILSEIKNQTNIGFGVNRNVPVEALNGYSIKIENQTVEAAIKTLTNNRPVTYELIASKVMIVNRPESKVIMQAKDVKPIAIKGKIIDKKGNPILGATIIAESGEGTITDDKGVFALTVNEGSVIEISCVGYVSQKFEITSKTVNFVVKLEEDEVDVQDIVVTGIYNRKAESFTGSAKTYNAKELKAVGNTNLLQSLKSLDPAVKFVENNQYGSDPNRTPDLEIRGKTSIVGLKEQFGEDPNQPLFILDGFETSLSTIMDLSLDRIGSVTILKDAASTAIYGAKAANGVIVVETVAPTEGKLRVSYNGNAIISFPDLTDYNLMNSAEKLEFELKSGRFITNLPTQNEELINRYNKLYSEVSRGVDTDWLSEPLRYGVNHRHGIYLQGGDSKMRYGMGINYSRNDGVMKQSERNVLGANIDFIYRTGKLNLSNTFSFSNLETVDPIVPFSQFSRANPYYRKYNEDGGIDMFLEAKATSDNALGYVSSDYEVGNPMWNYIQSSSLTSNQSSFTNNFNLEYSFLPELRLRGRISISNSNGETEDFYAPEDTRFKDDVILERGSYSNMISNSFSYSGDLTLTYGKVFNEIHMVNFVMGANARNSSSVNKSYSSMGFPTGFDNPSFANEYVDGKPSYSDSQSRNANFFLNGGYIYKDRYLMDINFRKDGSSVFGSNKRFTNTWALGLAWNLHKENFILDTGMFSVLKLRGSVGNPGNQNFGSFNTITTYTFNNWMQNNFGTGVLVGQFGDPNLDWQKTLDKNIGIDASMFRHRFHFSADFYHKRTDPLLTYIDVPISTGVSNRLMNMGIQVSKGFYASLKYSLIYKPAERKNWTISLDMRSNKSYYDEVGDALERLNVENIGESMTRYYDGASTSALYAVRSAGIDPATGREIFISKLTGAYVFDYVSSDEVIVGNTNPDIDGTFSSSLYWKGLSFNFVIRYSLGSEAFNSTLYQKVENISGNDLKNNQDKRALYDRWQKPGDIAKFKAINLFESSPMSSRFVSANDYLSLESVRLSYELDSDIVKTLGLDNLTLSGYMNDIFRWSCIKDERGIDYPFARSFSFSLSFNF